MIGLIRLKNTLDQRTIKLLDLQISNSQIVARLGMIDGRLLVLENDIKEIYKQMADEKFGVKLTKKQAKLNVEQKVLEAYKNVLLIAKDANVKLPL